MGKNFIKQTYNEYFRRLQQIAGDIDDLKRLVQQIKEPEVQSAIKAKITEMQQELYRYVENLEATGVVIYKHAA